MPSWIGLEEPSDSDEDRAYTEHVREVNKKRDAYLQRDRLNKGVKRPAAYSSLHSTWGMFHSRLFIGAR